MKQVLHKALPFLIAFVLGVACTAIFRSVWPTHRNSYPVGGRFRCKEKPRKDFSTGRYLPFEKTFSITQIQDSGWTDHYTVTIPENSVENTNFTLKEQALVASVRKAGPGSGNSIAASYASPDAIDGLPVTSDADIVEVPRPSLSRNAYDEWRASGCDMIVRVDLDSSGRVSRVEKAHGSLDTCQYLPEIIAAAQKIRFNPASRNGRPISERLSILYRLH